jgi:CTP:phosphocholine cytidylyltransferase-like protein
VWCKQVRTLTEIEFKYLYTIERFGAGNVNSDLDDDHILNGDVICSLRKKGWIDEAGITEKGLAVLEPYRVRNAVIMAAGLSSRFVPLSLEKPKGLLEIKGEVLIERQIEQLHEAGIHDIILVIGYKKEAFSYLEHKYEGLRLIFNPEYMTKNNTHTIYLVREHLDNTYICSSDDYFEINPFDLYVHSSYYASLYVDEKTDEWYMTPDKDNNIAQVKKSGDTGFIMLGHAYWNRAFSEAMRRFLVEDHDIGKYNDAFWEDILADNIEALPPMKIRVYPENTIFEFDSLEDLRAFDKEYLDNTRCQIMQNIARTLCCRESDIRDCRNLSKDFNRYAFNFNVFEKEYIYRYSEEDVMDYECYESLTVCVQ